MSSYRNGSSIIIAGSFLPVAEAYGAGDIIATATEMAVTYADGSAVPRGGLIRILSSVMKIDATALQASEAAYTLQLYSVTPPSAKANNAAWALESADLTAYRGSIDLGTPVDLGNALYVKKTALDADINLSGSTIFGQLVTVAGFTPTAVARRVFLYGVLL